jgi:putative transposase
MLPERSAPIPGRSNVHRPVAPKPPQHHRPSPASQYPSLLEEPSAVGRSDIAAPRNGRAPHLHLPTGAPDCFIARVKPKRLPRPPYNPGVRDLVQRKRAGACPLSKDAAARGFAGWHENGYLPHRDEPGLIQFVTFRLADSFPASLRAEWQNLLEIEDERKRRIELEKYLDLGRGECFLRRKEIAGVVENSLRLFHGDRYELRAWVVMPNHVHVLFKVDSVPMSKLVGVWKGFMANNANKLLGRKGQLWQDDYWDTYMRDAGHEQRTRRYIENNPLKAGLAKAATEWPWSSARYRDEYTVLRLPERMG